MPDIQLNAQSVTASSTTGTTAPAAGTSETWTVVALAGGIPTLTGAQTYALVDATAGASAGQQAEIIRVTAAVAAATSITVTRGADGTTPIAHATGSVYAIVAVATVLNGQVDYPSYAPLGLKRQFDPARAAYGCDVKVLEQFHSALGKARANKGLCEIGIYGDSYSDGFMGTANAISVDHLHGWPLLVKALLLAAGVPDGGTGWVKFGGAIQMLPGDPRWTTTGTWTRYSGNLYGSTAAGNAGATATLALPGGLGVKVQVAFPNTSAAMTYVIKDSGGTTLTSGTFAPTGAGSTQVWTSGVLVDAASIVITAVGSGTNTLIGARIDRTAGMVMSNFAIYGTKVSGALGWEASTYNYAGPQALSLLAAPDLVLLMHGGNDLLSGTISSAAIYTGMTNGLARYPNASKVVVSEWQPAIGNGTQFSDANYQLHTSGLYTLADTLGVGLVDAHFRSGGYTAMNGRGEFEDGSNGVHPNQTRHADLAQQVLGVLTG